MLWVIFGGLAAFAAAFLVLGFLRRPRDLAPRVEHDLEVYRAQLGELERERGSGLISNTDAEAARIEIQRRILAADRARETGKAERPAQRDAIATVVVAAGVPLAALGVYLMLGNPEVPSMPFAERAPQPATMDRAQDQAGQGNLPDVEIMLARVRARLAKNPDDLAGWSILGRSLAALDRFDEAIAAFDRAISLSGGDADLFGAKAETLIVAAQGQVTPDARAALAQALSIEPGDPRARYYMATAKQQAGQSQAALDDLVALLGDAPADAPWFDAARQHAAALATELGLDPGTVLPEARVAGAGARAAGELAARLQADPKDFRGWIELARLRAGLGDPEGARDALDLGAQAYQGAPFVQQQFRQTAAELGLSEPSGGAARRGPDREDMEAAAQMTPEQQQDMIRGMVGGLAERLKDSPNDLGGWQMLARSYGVLGDRDKAAEAYRRVLALDPANTDALFFLGEAAAARGDRGRAADYWIRLLARLAPGSAEHAMVQERLDRLNAAN